MENTDQTRNMSKFIFTLIGITICIGGGYVLLRNFDSHDQTILDVPSTALQTSMEITSTVFHNNEPIPVKYTCDGMNSNPSLMIANIPEEAKSLALVIDDPDAPSDTWVHWILWNIHPSTTAIAEHSVPPGAVEGMTSFGKPGYGGPCPPTGSHRYFFKLYALDTMLYLSPNADKELLEAAMEGHVVTTSQLIGVYSRK